MAAPRRRSAPSPAPRRAPRRPSVLPAAALLALTVVSFVPALQAGFVWDDDDYVTANRTLRDVRGFARIWVEPGAVVQYYPATFSSLWLEYRLWGASPAGYHATNVLLHAVSVVLLWRLLVLLGVPGAWIGAALFAVHPVEVESVAWITERKNVLSGALALGAALAYLRAALPDGSALARPRLYALALALFVGALLAKTVVCTLPVTLALVLWWKRGRLGRRELTPLVPFLAVGLVLGLVTVLMERYHVGARGAFWNLTLLDRCLIAGRAIWFYLATLVWPARLTFIYPRWRIDAGAWWQYVFPAAAAAGIVALFVARDRLGRGPVVALLAFVATLGPALGFVDVYPMRYSFVADHFQYHASIFPLVLAAAGLTTAVADRRVREGVVAGVLVVLVALAWRQGLVYRDLHTLWDDTLAKNPGAAMAHVNLGMLWHREGRPERAVEEFRAALRLDPSDAEVHDDLGMALAAAGRMDDARASFAEALRLDPRDAKTHNNLANTLARQGRTADAIAEYEAAIALDARYADAHNNLANVLAQSGRTDEAIAHYGEALRIDPEYVEALHNLGVLLAARGRANEALAYDEAALRLDPDFAPAHFDAANALVALGRPREAVAHYRAALARQPDWPDALGRLAWLLATEKDGDRMGSGEAIALAERACTLTGNADPVLLDVLAAAYGAGGRRDAAIATAEKALALAQSAGRTDVAEEIAGRLDAYRAGRAGGG